MRPTSESDRDAHTEDSPADSSRNDPWAGGPGHLTNDDQTERFVPEQRDGEHDAGHDGRLYASDSYHEPETTVLPDGSAASTTYEEQGKDVSPADPDATAALPDDQRSEGYHDSAVGVAHVDADRSEDAASADDAPSAEHAADKADEAKAEAEEARVEAEEAGAGEHGTRYEPEVETVGLPPAEPVAVVEPVEDRPGDFTAVPVEDTATAEDTPTDLKPGDVPVTPVTGFFAADAAQGLRDRWREAQLGFVDDPRQAVDDVKALVSEAVEQFTAAVSAQRDELDAAAGDDTEQYRVAVQRYRSFFDRLLGL